MSQSNQSGQKVSNQRRKALLGLTMGLMVFEPVAPAFANNMGAWANSANIGKSHGSLPLIPINQHVGSWGAASAIPQVNNAANASFTSHLLNFGKNHINATSAVYVAPSSHATAATSERGQSAGQLALDLTSSTANIMLGSRLFAGHSAATISVGGASETFRPGATVTAAQYIAIEQVLASSVSMMSWTDPGRSFL